jgi:hypothetical protein
MPFEVFARQGANEEKTVTMVMKRREAGRARVVSMFSRGYGPDNGVFAFSCTTGLFANSPRAPASPLPRRDVDE